MDQRQHLGFQELENSLKNAEKELLSVMSKREKLLKESRDVISSSSRAIVNIHTGKLQGAASELEKARTLLADLRTDGTRGLSRYLIPPESEYVEAAFVNAVVRKRKTPSLKSLGVSPEAYLLGLLDGIGELKRLTLDSIMDGRVLDARKFFSIMETLYSLLSPFAVFDNVVNGVRRKIDVARILIEDTRGVLAEESRRGKLVSSMDRLYKRLGKP
jgi:translin